VEETKAQDSKNTTVTKPSGLVDSVEALEAKISEVKKAQKIYSTFTQEQVDAIFLACALAGNKARIPLAKMAVEETGRGIVVDKVIKNHYASEYMYNAWRRTKTCGVIEDYPSFRTKVIAEPLGVVGAVTPVTNPTSTTIFKILISLKTRNGIILCPHPSAKKCSIEAAKILLEAAIKAGAPEGIIGWVDEPSLDLTNYVMQHVDVVLATGGPGMVKSAYSSGKPSYGVGPGNCQAIIDETADVRVAVNSIIHSKTFDNGMICASEQSIIIVESVYEAVKAEFSKRGCHILKKGEETDKIRKVLFPNGALSGLNAKIVGHPAWEIAQLGGVDVPKETKVLIGEAESTEPTEEFVHEKLSPVLGLVKAKDFHDALNKVDKVFEGSGGIGHTSVLYTNQDTQRARIDEFQLRMRTGRILINTPSSQGAIGDLYNFKLLPSLTLGCGSWAGNTVAENVGVKHLMNRKTVAERTENMLWFRTPDKVYFKKGSLPIALDELQNVLGKKKAFIVTDSFLFANGYIKPITDKLDEMGIVHTTYSDVQPDPTLGTALKGAEQMRQFGPDVIIAIGGGSAMDAGKIMWVLYEHPEENFLDLAVRFVDIRKRIYFFPKMGEKAYFVAIPTSAGTGSEVTPFAVITDESTGTKYPLADYELMPDMAIIDADMMMSAPKGLTSASGIDAVTHAVEAYASMLATDFTDGIALRSLKMVFEFLPRAYNDGQTDSLAREKMGHAASMAGMAFANAFLGICHSLAHKLGAFHHLPHGIANALLINEVIRFNAVDVPSIMGTFSQYPYPKAASRYAEIADHLGLKGRDDHEKVEALCAAIDELKAKVGIKKTIKDYGIDEKDFLDRLDAMTENAFDDQCTGANPRYPKLEELKAIYLKAYYGK
jgi:acetaldehyde dehydrogenase/alcohol dehydrogenase